MHTITKSNSHSIDPISIDALLPRHNFFKDRIDQQLLSCAPDSPDSLFATLTRSALFPGRRLRPFLLYWLLDTQNADSQRPQDQDIDLVALAVEYAHRASIILDDIIDADMARRNLPTVHRLYGPDLAILMSHHLVAQAYAKIHQVSQMYQPPILADLTRTYQNMCLGELADIGVHTSVQCDYVSVYIDTTLKKTSSLFEFVYTAAGRFLALTEPEIIILGNIGRSVGELYQICNDVYDEIKAGPDVRGPKKTTKVTLSLPNAYVLDYGRTQDRNFLRNYLGRFCPTTFFQSFRLRSYDDSMQVFCDQILRERLNRVDNALKTVSFKTIASRTNTFTKWLRADKCWDHRYYNESGY